jgi:hypothetical protein
VAVSKDGLQYRFVIPGTRVTTASYFDQGTRNVACMAEVLSKARRQPSEVNQKQRQRPAIAILVISVAQNSHAVEVAVTLGGGLWLTDLVKRTCWLQSMRLRTTRAGTLNIPIDRNVCGASVK